MTNHGPEHLQCRIADQLAAALGGKAVHNQEQWHCEIEAGGVTVVLHTGRGHPFAERAEVSLSTLGLWSFLPYGTAVPTMTFLMSRDPLRVAAEVLRKVIEPGRPLIDEALMRKTHADALEAARKAASERLREIVGGSLTDHEDIYIPHSETLYGKITAHGPESFTIDVHVSRFAVAEQMLKAMMAALVAQAPTEEVTL